MIIRGLAGVIIGIAYGFLVGLLVFLRTRVGLKDTPTAGMILLDPAAMAWFATVLSGIIAGACAALVGLIVALARVGKPKAATIGFLTGLIPIIVLSLAGPFPSSLREWIDLLELIVILPVGVALIGIVVSIVAERLKRVLL